ncbi:MAG: hypothetical protein ABJC26_16645 [Gemmatimonadaceae bacterium]
MTPMACSGAVLYAKNVTGLKHFYQSLLALNDESIHVATDHVAINTPTFQLVLVEVPADVAAYIVIENPPRTRSEVPVKLVFDVPSIADARVVSAHNGGEVLPEAREWNFDAFRVCDGRDPEGNVIQLRQQRDHFAPG